VDPGALLAVSFDWDFFLKFVFSPSSALIGGLAITIYASVIAQVSGVILGVLSALAGMSRNRVIRTISGVYVWFFRGTPVLVQIFLVYFGTPYLLGIDLFPSNISAGWVDLRGAVLAGIVALSVNEGAYMSEIVRAGILSVDPGQTEAAKSLGMTYRLTMSRIVLPQALRVIIPPLGNEFNNMFKTTSLLSIIAVSETFRVAQAVNSATFKAFEAYFGVALYYLALTTIWTVVQGMIERRLGVSTGREERPSTLERMFGLRRRTTPVGTVDIPAGTGSGAPRP
jgi:polar amino acid transport system permease protein